MIEKTCLKCGHNETFAGAAPAACPVCGAIYAKVEEAVRIGSAVRPPITSGMEELGRSFRQRRGQQDIQVYADQMRSQSLYPVWRKIVGFFTAIGYCIAAIVFVVSFFALFSNSFAAGLAGLASAVVVALLAKVGKELSLMLADLSDAAVRAAAAQEAHD